MSHMILLTYALGYHTRQMAPVSISLHIAPDAISVHIDVRVTSCRPMSVEVTFQSYKNMLFEASPINVPFVVWSVTNQCPFCCLTPHHPMPLLLFDASPSNAAFVVDAAPFNAAFVVWCITIKCRFCCLMRHHPMPLLLFDASPSNAFLFVWCPDSII